jgi:hypothetical protein
MTEDQWRTSTDPAAMLAYLHGRVTERKLRLFACACVRRHWEALTDPRSQRAIEVAERYAEGLATEVERFDAWDDASAVGDESRLVLATVHAIESDDVYAFGDVVGSVVRLTVSRAVEGAEQAAQCALLRCLFGPRPFARPPRVPDAVRAWDDRTVPRLARTLYEEYAFDHLGVLADALEEAGHADGDLLEHLRGPGPHARGCFALDSCLLP